MQQLKRTLRRQIAEGIRREYIPFYLTEGVARIIQLIYQNRILTPRADLNVEKVISSQYSFLLVCLPKVASQSIIETFVVNPALDWNAYIDESTYSKVLDRPECCNLYKIAFVRNPWDRIASCYRDKIVYPSTVFKIRYTHRYRGIWPDMPFEQFIEWLACTEEGSDTYADRHWISQHKLLEEKSGHVVYDFLVRFESLESDLKSVFQSIGAPEPVLSVVNTTTDRPRSARSDYDRRTYSLIKQRYARDIELLGYAD